jgi:DNA-binding PadR family transcriptional regulator
MDDMRELTLFETIFLLAVSSLSGNAYGVTIRTEVARISGRTIPYGTLYSYLEQLSRKGLISKALGAPTSERGGRTKILYHVTPAGIVALKEASRIQKSVSLRLERFLKAEA